MDVHVELLGADLTEHLVKHGHVNIVGVTRALSAFRPVLDTSNVDCLKDVGLNPGHDKHLDMVKILARKKKYKLSKILRDITKNNNLGISMVRNLIPKKKTSGLSSKSKVEKFKTKFRSSSIGTENIKTSNIAWIN
ncbi:hypothetical protein NQ314_018527 [Rhamnusium bicolor]|uniref:Uncharacterized protein n=1 Tax=Rhamnusium bicolor TaxID=1586634 RepID=A0AAV8WRU2_9CUCU|nr:hypothetical protein NQ314_018527 [Rhamnusium bicolor]